MPTSQKVLKKILDSFPEMEVKTIYELGSGWGTVAFRLARAFPDCRVYGFEVSPIPFWVSKAVQRFTKTANLSLHRKDFFKVSFTPASALFCYLYPGAMLHLQEKFLQELIPGTVIVTHTFALPCWTPVRIDQAPDLYGTKIYTYSVPKN